MGETRTAAGYIMAILAIGCIAVAMQSSVKPVEAMEVEVYNTQTGQMNMQNLDLTSWGGGRRQGSFDRQGYTYTGPASTFNHQRDNSFDRVGYTYTGPASTFNHQRDNSFDRVGYTYTGPASQFNHQRDNSFDRVGYTYTGPLTVFAGQRANPFQK